MVFGIQAWCVLFGTKREVWGGEKHRGGSVNSVSQEAHCCHINPKLDPSYKDFKV